VNSGRPYTFTDDVADRFAQENSVHQQTPKEILATAPSQTPDEKLTNFAIRLAPTGYVIIPRENELDFHGEEETRAQQANPRQGRTEEGGDIQEEICGLTEQIGALMKGQKELMRHASIQATMNVFE